MRPCRSTTPADQRVDRRIVGDLEGGRLSPLSGFTNLRHRFRCILSARGGDDMRAPRRQHHGNARPMPRDAPVTIATLPERSNMTRLNAKRFLQRGEIVRLREVRHDRFFVDLLDQPAKTVPGPTSTYVVTPSDASRRTTSSQRTGADTCLTSASMAAAASRFGSASTLATTGTRGFRAASARNSGSSRSSAGFSSAQWNGALTDSGMIRLAPSAFARSLARCTALVAPAMTT